MIYIYPFLIFFGDHLFYFWAAWNITSDCWVLQITEVWIFYIGPWPPFPMPNFPIPFQGPFSWGTGATEGGVTISWNDKINSTFSTKGEIFIPPQKGGWLILDLKKHNVQIQNGNPCLSNPIPRSTQLFCSSQPPGPVFPHIQHTGNI